MNITIEFCILKLVYVQNWTKCPSQICPKRVFLVENRKGEQHHGLLHFQTGLSIKFLPKLTIFIFWTKFTQKGISRLKQKKKLKMAIVFRTDTFVDEICPNRLSKISKQSIKSFLRHCPSKNSAIWLAIWTCLAMPCKYGSSNL